MDDPEIAFGQAYYSFDPDEFNCLVECLKINDNIRGKALESFTSQYPCDLKKVLWLWLPVADKIIEGYDTWDKYLNYIQGLGHWIKRTDL